MHFDSFPHLLKKLLSYRPPPLSTNISSLFKPHFNQFPLSFILFSPPRQFSEEEQTRFGSFKTKQSKIRLTRLPSESKSLPAPVARHSSLPFPSFFAPRLTLSPCLSVCLSFSFLLTRTEPRGFPLSPFPRLFQEKPKPPCFFLYTHKHLYIYIYIDSKRRRGG